MKGKLSAAKAAFPLTIPIMMGYLFLGMAFGILLQSKGYSFVWALLMSGFIYAGSMQFVAVSLLTGAVSLVNVVLMTLMVNARHLFYGLSMLEEFKGFGKRKPYMVFSLTDETFSLLCSAKEPEGVDRKWFQFFISFFDQLYWLAGSVLGAVAGSLITFNTKGIDFAMTALFTVIVIEQWKGTKNHIPALTGLVGSVICLLIFGPSGFILPSMILMVAVLTIFRKKVEEKS